MTPIAQAGIITLKHTDALSRRKDIQGLRSISILLVAIYHIWIGRVSGGVDVFFVVSGYLLIGSLVRQLENHGRIELFDFACRLANRLLPAAFLVIAIILLTGWIWLPQMQWWGTARQIVSSTLYVQNWFLAFNAVDYLERDQIASPLLHYWAMSAQVQALLLVAAILCTYGIVTRAIGSKPKRSWTLAIISSLTIASLLYSILATAHHQAFAYYDTLARVWEFSIGGLVAIGAGYISLSLSIRHLLGWFGLAGILSCGMILNVSTLFPGYAALWPVAAASLILIAGGRDIEHAGVYRLLASKPLVSLGNISYGIYLWHWPILTLYLTLTYREQAGLLDGSLVLVVSILLAKLSTELIERPAKASLDRLPKAGTVLATCCALALISGGTYLWNDYKNNLLGLEKAVLQQNQHYLIQSPLTVNKSLPQANIRPGPMMAKQDLGEAYERWCIESMEGAELRSCQWGRSDAKQLMMLVGVLTDPL